MCVDDMLESIGKEIFVGRQNHRKVICILLICIAYPAFCQEANTSVSEIISTGENMLNNQNIPNGFRRMNRQIYKMDINESTSWAIAETNKLKMVFYGRLFQFTDSAADFQAPFYNYLEKYGNYVGTTPLGDTYELNNIYVIIGPPSKRDDGYIIADIVFDKNPY